MNGKGNKDANKFFSAIDNPPQTKAEPKDNRRKNTDIHIEGHSRPPGEQGNGTRPKSALEYKGNKEVATIESAQKVEEKAQPLVRKRREAWSTQQTVIDADKKKI